MIVYIYKKDMSYSHGTRARFPVIVNTTMTLADTEYDQELPENCKGFIIHTRDESSFRLAFETGHVATPIAPYFTVPANRAFGQAELSIDTYGGVTLTLYFASDDAGKIIEIIYWT